jgi:hypothetical protein
VRWSIWSRAWRGAVLAVFLGGAACWLAPPVWASGAWTPVDPYALPAGALAGSAQLAFGTGGVATAAYLDSAGELHAGTVAPGSAFAEQLAVPGATALSLAEAPDGAAVLAWSTATGSTQAAYRPAGRRVWATPVTVAAAVTGRLLTAIAAGGQAAAGVQPSAGGGYRVATFHPTGGFGSLVGTGGGAAPALSGLALGYDAAGTLTVALAAAGKLEVQALPASSAALPPAIVAVDVAAGALQLAVAPDGAAVLGYEGPAGVEAAVRGPGTGAGWSTPIVVAPGATPLSAAISPGTVARTNRAYVVYAGGGCVGIVRAPVGGAFSPARCLPGASAPPASPASAELAFGARGAVGAASTGAGVFAIGWPMFASAPDAAVPLASSGALTEVLGDGAGDIAALWDAPPGGGLDVSAFVTSGPVLVASHVPRVAVVDRSVTMSATFADLWSGVAALPTWSFGGGVSVQGAQVSHAYGRAGTYTVRVTAVDALGNRTSARFKVVVRGGAAGL